jgi:trimethylamine--corrinoid protein Co-methyltransferase
MDPRSGLVKSGAVESNALSAASAEMARYYGLPAEISGLGTGRFIPDVQSGYERAMRTLQSVLSWPDIIVGAGMLGGAMILSLEQMVIDAEIFRICKHAHRGIVCDNDKWLDDVIERVGPGGHFLDQPSTASAVRSKEWFENRLGINTAFEDWQDAGRPDIVAEAREKVDQILTMHQPLPLEEEADRELDRIRKRASESVA